MNFLDLKLDKNSRLTAQQLDSYREIYNDIHFESIFEPIQIREVINNKMTVILTCVDDIRAWQKEIGYSCLVKMKYLEESIIKLIDSSDLYSSAILVRQHMELCGLLALSLEVLNKSLKENNYEDLNRFVSKTWFGTPFNNNSKLKDGFLAFMGTETVTISSMIKALDNFIHAHKEEGEEIEPNLYVHNYACLCQIVHPSAISSSFFNDASKVDEGHIVNFKWEPDFTDKAIPTVLKILSQNLLIGLASYFVFMAHIFLDDGSVICDDEKLEYSFYNVLHRFNKNVKRE